MDILEIKKLLGYRVLKYIPKNSVVGVGTGSTAKCFMRALVDIKDELKAVVASSIDSEQYLHFLGFRTALLIEVDEINVYIDGTDSYNDNKQLLKGRGGALMREKILAMVSSQFIVLAEKNKYDPELKNSPVVVEVIPIARSYVAHEIIKLGGMPVLRDNFVSDNGNLLLDVYNMPITMPIVIEEKLNNIVGVVGHGLFAKRGADLMLIADQYGNIEEYV